MWKRTGRENPHSRLAQGAKSAIISGLPVPENPQMHKPLWKRNQFHTGTEYWKPPLIYRSVSWSVTLPCVPAIYCARSAGTIHIISNYIIYAPMIPGSTVRLQKYDVEPGRCFRLCQTVYPPHPPPSPPPAV